MTQNLTDKWKCMVTKSYMLKCEEALYTHTHIYMNRQKNILEQRYN